MISVIIIGYGNVGQHLTTIFLNNSNIDLKQVYARSINKINHLKNKTKITDNFENLVDANIYIISVSDNAIEEVSQKIQNKNAFVVHTSGATDMSKLKNNGRKGVFYMLQSFSKNTPVDFKKIPFCIEAEDKSDLNTLEKVALEIGEKIYFLDSSQRKVLHVSAVFVNNFTNHLYKIGNDICKQNNIPFEILYPLINETANKIKELPPKEAQTGPAIRNDYKTIKNHLSLLNKHQQSIYKLLTESIQNEH